MLVEKETYLLELSRYIHLNPFRAGMVKSPENYKWSSLYEMLKNSSGKLPFTLYMDWLLESFGKRKGAAARKYLEFVREGIKDMKNPGLEATGGWILGSETRANKIIKKWIDFSSKEITGIKPLSVRIPVNRYEQLVCKEFEISKQDLKKLTYNNIARMSMIYLAHNYCASTLKVIGQRYGRISDSAVNKVVSRFSTRLLNDKRLNAKIKNCVKWRDVTLFFSIFFCFLFVYFPYFSIFINMRRIFIKIIQLSTYWPFLFLFRILFNFKVERTDNLEQAGTSFILAVNHISYLDPISVCIALPFRLKFIPLFYMASDFFYKILFFYRFVGGVRARMGTDLELSSRPLINILAHGERVVIFPEGGINRGVKRRPRRGISYVASKSNKLIVPLKIESNLDGAVSVLGGSVIDLLTGKHWIKMVFGKPFKIDETIGKIPESLSELRKASEGVFQRIIMAK